MSGVPAVTRIDNADVRGDVARNKMRRTRIAVAYDKHVTEHCLQVLQGVQQGFALAGCRGADVDVEYVGRKPFGGQFKRRACSCAGFEKKVGDRLAAQDRHLLHALRVDVSEGFGRVEDAGQYFAAQAFNGQKMLQPALGVELYIPVVAANQRVRRAGGLVYHDAYPVMTCRPA